MGKFILYNSKGAVTAKQLAKTLGMRRIRDDKYKVTDGIPTIRWGCSKNIDGDNCKVNSAAAIRVAADGIKSLKILSENDIHTPKIYIAMNEIPDDTVLLARNINHAAGRDIVICRDKYEAVLARRSGKQFFTEFLETSMELRTHVINGEVVKCFKKVKLLNINDPREGFVRSSKFGWSFKLVDVFTHYPKAIPVAIKAVNTLGLVFGAVDMAWDINKKQWVIWEINSAPALNTETLQLYKEKLLRLI